MQIFLFLSLVVAAFAILFALQNNAQTEIRLLTFQLEGSLALIILFTLALGALISFLASLPALIRARLNLRSQQKRVEELEKSLADQKMQTDNLQKRLAALHEVEKPASETVDTGQESGKKLWQG
jgi:putative membrane protein